MSKKVLLELTEDEAWVLFDLTRRFSDSDKLSIKHQAEERALWNLCCTFEKTLHQAKDVTYAQFIQECRDRLKDE